MSQRRRERLGPAGCLALALSGAALTTTTALAAEPLAVATRGINGTVMVRSDTGPLMTRADLALDAPLVARIAAARAVDEDAGTVWHYTIEFMGTVEGPYDLRTVLQRPDGSFPADLDPILVEIERHLAIDAGTDVFVDATPAPPISSVYRATLIAVFVAWALVPVAILGVRLARRLRVEEEVPLVPPPSLAERLEPLVLAAADRTMSVEERGQLELLLLAHLGERAGVSELNRAGAIAALRQTADAGPLLTAVESWLHRPGPVEDRRATVSVLLAPFRHAADVPPAGGDSGAAAAPAAATAAGVTR